MTLQYLMDENVNPIYANEIRRKNKNLIVLSVGDISTQKVHLILIFYCGVKNMILF